MSHRHPVMKNHPLKKNLKKNSKKNLKKILKSKSLLIQNLKIRYMMRKICYYPMNNFLVQYCFSTEQNNFLNFCKNSICIDWTEYNTLKAIRFSFVYYYLKSCF
jgi:NADH:ubiquinone oxidoreductase subunit C